MGQFTGTNDYITGRKPVPSADSFGLVAVRFTLAMATADLALNSIGQIGVLPAGAEPVEVFIDGTDMDSGAGAAVYQIGIGNLALQDAAGAVSADAKNTLISTIAADGGGAWGDTSTAVATAFDKRMTRTLNNMANVTAKNYDRAIVAKVTTAPSTAVAGTLGVTLFYRNAQ